VVHQRPTAVGSTGTDRAPRRAVAEIKVARTADLRRRDPRGTLATGNGAGPLRGGPTRRPAPIRRNTPEWGRAGQPSGLRMPPRVGIAEVIPADSKVTDNGRVREFRLNPDRRRRPRTPTGYSSLAT